MKQYIFHVICLLSCSSIEAQAPHVWKEEVTLYRPLKPLNSPPESNVIDCAEDSFEYLQEYYHFMKNHMKQKINDTVSSQRENVLRTANEKLFAFTSKHLAIVKRLLHATDVALLAMVTLKFHKKIATAESKIRSLQARIPLGLYTSPEFKCLGTSYYIASTHSREDVQMLLDSVQKPHCHTFKGIFTVGGFTHRPSEGAYVGPFGEEFHTTDPSQGFYCRTADSRGEQCVYKINPLEHFPEAVEYQPKVSYFCGPYRYFLPPTTQIRCDFSTLAMDFVLSFGYNGVNYRTSGLTFMYQNGQNFYVDEPWSGVGCIGTSCRWRHPPHNIADHIHSGTV